jgi:hypothetical protein
MSAAPEEIVPASGDALVSEYEALRGVALGGLRGPSQGVGFALLLRRGMAVWMDACTKAAASSSRLRPLSRQEQCLLPPDLRGEVAMVLATMALACPMEGGMTA